jgi:hypothetical protein
MDVTRTITYHGSVVRASALVEMLRQEGVQAEWPPPFEARGRGAFANEVAFSVVSTGTLAGIVAAVKKFRKLAPECKVEVEGEPDDGGSLDEDVS